MARFSLFCAQRSLPKSHMPAFCRLIVSADCGKLLFCYKSFLYWKLSNSNCVRKSIAIFSVNFMLELSRWGFSGNLQSTLFSQREEKLKTHYFKNLQHELCMYCEKAWRGTQFCSNLLKNLSLSCKQSGLTKFNSQSFLSKENLTLTQFHILFLYVRGKACYSQGK